VRDVDASERLQELYEHAIEAAASLTEASESGDHETVLSLLDELEDIVDELEDVLSTVELDELIAAVDWSDLPDAVELGDIPEAVDEGDATEAISLRKLLAAIDLTEVWDSMDERAMWRQKRELDDEVDDLTGDGDDDGSLLERNEDDGDENDDLVDVSMPGTSSGGGAGGHDFDPRSVENAIQMQVSESVGEFREKLLAAHRRFAKIREQNEERFPDRGRNGSRNPTAVSTVPPSGPAERSATTHSTVPEETRHSSAPNRRRIYGPRFDRAEEVTDE
jgi:hypothetical protein